MKISDDPGAAAQTRPRIGIDGAGNLIAAWLDARTSPVRVRAARKPAGGSWSASIEVSPSPANAQSLALSVRADGYAWVTWGDTRAGGSNADIWGSRYDPYLNTWSPPQRLDDAAGTTAQLGPTVAFTASETMLSWRDNRLNANGNTQARRLVFLPGLTDHVALAYDGLHRLVSVKGPVSESFALDSGSNVTNRSGTVDTYDNANRLIAGGSTATVWSDADRLAQRGTDVFGYDSLDRLTSSTVASTSRTYAYNGDGLLQSRTQSGTTSFLWDAATSPSRDLKQGNDNIIYGLGPLYVVKGDSSIATLARDGSKNVRAEVSSAGAVTGAFSYRAYGQIAQATIANPTYFGAGGQLLDTSGLYFMRARWMDPNTGRFISRDRMSGNTLFPVTLNPFVYGNANPIAFVDPTGLAAASDPDAAGGTCRHVATCGTLSGMAKDAADTVLDEYYSAVAATKSQNPVIAATGYVELIAAGALVISLIAAGAAVAAPATASAGSATFTAAGTLTAGAIANGRPIIEGVALRNPAVIQELTRDGSAIQGWAKYATTFASPSGAAYEVHYYYNRAPGLVNYLIDYKTRRAGGGVFP